MENQGNLKKLIKKILLKEVPKIVKKIMLQSLKESNSFYQTQK
jgi:hypothetical protein